MSIIKRFTKEGKAEIELDKIRKMSDMVLGDLRGRIPTQGTMSVDEPGSNATTRVPTRVVPHRPLKKNKSSKDRELMMNGNYLNQYNFGDLYAAYTKETYFKIAVDKFVEGIVQRGFHFDSKTQIIVDYIRKRLKELHITSKKHLKDIIRDITFSLLLYGNAFLVRVRDNNRSSGMKHLWNGKDVNPVAGWYVADPRRVVIKEKKSGGTEYLIIPAKVRGLKSKINHAIQYIKNFPGGPSLGNSRMPSAMWGITSNTADIITLNEDDVDHIRYHHTPGEKWAMPPFWPVLEDINLLRSTETAVDLLIYQFGSLLIHVSVANPIQNIANAAIKKPARMEDIEDVKATLNNMESNGFIVTGDHVDMKVLQVAGNILKLSEYLAYFKARVFSGLWISPVIIGESAPGMARSTADTVIDEKIGKLIELQSIIGTSIDMLCIEFLLEAGLSYAQATRPNVIPSLVFDDVDIELKLKKQDSILRLYENGLLTEHEGRRKLGLDELSDAEREMTYPRLVKGYLLELEMKLKGDLQLEVANIQAKATMDGARLTAKAANAKESGASRKAANNINTPNQTGKKLNSKKPVNR